MKELARTRHEPGFRPGHAPMGMLEKKYGKAVRYDVIDKSISHELFEYIRKEQLPVLGNPMPDPDTIANLDANEWCSNSNLVWLRKSTSMLRR